MSYSNRDTDWDLSAKGNYWRRINGKVLVVGTKDGEWYWAMMDGNFAADMYGTVEEAIRAMKQGAHDFLTKPCRLSELEAVLAKALEKLPADRFANAKDFGDALANPHFLNGSAGGRGSWRGRPSVPGRR